MVRRHVRTPRALTLGLLLLAYPISVARAACNVIPGPTQTFRASQTTIDRPFAGPGDFVTLGLDPTCSTVERTFSPTPSDQVVTIVFTPPAGPRNVVVLAADCSRMGTCPGAAATTCVPTNQPNQSSDLQVLDAQHLRVRFPDTDSLVRSATDALTLTGPATVAVTRAGDPIPCALTAHTCVDEMGVLPLLACADALFAADATCGVTLDPTFPHFTALPFLGWSRFLWTLDKKELTSDRDDDDDAASG
jgi:hypothetical protein